jgi:hypothetical protein
MTELRAGSLCLPARVKKAPSVFRGGLIGSFGGFGSASGGRRMYGDKIGVIEKRAYFRTLLLVYIVLVHIHSLFSLTHPL